MHIGGVQKALVNLLKEIASEYEVTLLLFYKGGELLRDVPENVQVITACKALRGWGATREDAAGLRVAAFKSVLRGSYTHSRPQMDMQVPVPVSEKAERIRCCHFVSPQRK